ncbi:hypothetical protein B0H14DRAFT_642719 [Mycena olivaceomarginata]|nr:hypothetical protein B0H14DRAFT_642719 [Mycena olivaceomarginata]
MVRRLCTPLAEVNEQFEILRERRRLTPVAELLGLINTSGIPQPPITDSNADIPAAANNSADSDDDEYVDLPVLEVPADSDDEDEPEVDADEDLFAESPTLSRMDEGDLELDMDDVPEWYLDEVDEEYSDSGSEGEYDA